jgi:hypothetical protein
MDELDMLIQNSTILKISYESCKCLYVLFIFVIILCPIILCPESAVRVLNEIADCTIDSIWQF